MVKEIERLLPREKIVYFGDTARVPYGTKSRETITRFSIENVKFLLRFKVKLIVVACNTASSLALGTLRKRFKIPIIGVINPGAARALRLSKSKRIGVIGTKATVASNIYETLIKKAAPESVVISRSCPLFVPLAEEGWLHSKITKSITEAYLKIFRERKIDTLILGCTHYPLLKKVIKKVVGKRVVLVDSASETAREVKKMLAEKRLISGRKGSLNHKFFVSDDPAGFINIGKKFLGRTIKCTDKVEP